MGRAAAGVERGAGTKAGEEVLVAPHLGAQEGRPATAVQEQPAAEA